MNADDIERAKEAGKIASGALLFGKRLIKKEEKLLFVIEEVERYISEKGGKPAFPAQISLNDTAAHDTVKLGDERTFKESLVKLDVGVHMDGIIADNALTVDLTGANSHILKSSYDALQKAQKLIKKGARITEVSGAIEDSIKHDKLKPISNLSGHGLGKYMIHTAVPQIANIRTGNSRELDNGMHFAVEPFATDGFGSITEQGDPEIFSLSKDKNIRDSISRSALKIIRAYKGLPFSVRWIANEIGQRRAEYAINKLALEGMLNIYKPLVEIQGGLVSQHEKTFIIDNDKTIVTTRWDD